MWCSAMRTGPWSAKTPSGPAEYSPPSARQYSGPRRLPAARAPKSRSSQAATVLDRGLSPSRDSGVATGIHKPVGERGWPVSVQTLEDGSDALAAADTHCDQRPARPGALQFVHRFDAEDATGCANGMADRDAAAIRIGRVHWQSEIADDRQCLRGERLVDLEQVDILQLQACTFEDLAHGWHRTNAHIARLHASVRVGHQSTERLETTPLGCVSLHQDHCCCCIV